MLSEITTQEAISIHALREEGDPSKGGRAPILQTISIHALREEGDFLPKQKQRFCKYFYPRPPRGGRHQEIYAQGTAVDISIHALREEGDAPLGCDP